MALRTRPKVPAEETDRRPVSTDRWLNAYQRRRAASQRRHWVAVDAWETHIGRCTSCLTQGQWYCLEGTYLTRNAFERRERLVELDRSIHRLLIRRVALAKSLALATVTPETVDPWSAPPAPGSV